MIEAMTHVAVVADAARRGEVLDWLYKAKAMHVLPLAGAAEQADAPTRQAQTEEWDAHFKACPDTVPEIESRVAALSAVSAFCREHRSVNPGFLDQLFPLKTMTSRREMDDAVAACDADALSADLAKRRDAMEKAQERVAALELRRELIAQFAWIGDALPKLPGTKRVLFRLIAAQGAAEEGFMRDERITAAHADVAAEKLRTDGQVTYFGLAASPEHAAALTGLIEDHGLNVVALPKLDKSADAELAGIEADLARALSERDAAKTAATAFADHWDRKAELALAFVESERARRQQQPGMAVGKHIFTARGYVRTAALDTLKSELDTKFDGGATLLPVAAPEGEEPPTSLTWNKLIRPASLLVKMYGLPAYRGIDPTPCVATIFFTFVGICLGDALYGVLLIGAMLWLKRRYHDQKGLQDFFNLFVYCGVTTIVFGTLTGSFFANLSMYLAKAMPGIFEPVEAFRLYVTQLDPIAEAQTALAIAVSIGVFTQFYGLILRIYRDARRGDYMGAFSDGFLWLALLAGLVTFGLASAVAAVPDALATPALWVTGLAAVGLILTQGRENKNWVLRILVGVISLYGIVGAYGLSAFLGDVISFARLMALALTSAALGSTFNMLAQLAAEAGVIGVILAVFVVIFGHLMNFALSVLSAFVHSARLVMLEYFGRFYEAGGYAYAPHGFQHAVVEIDDETPRG